MFISPIVLGNIGITPYNVDCVGINATAATDFEVGALVELDLRQSLSTDLIPGGDDTGWANFNSPSVNAAQRPEQVGFFAVYLGKDGTSQVQTLSAGEKGRFRLHGMVHALVNNPDTAAIAATGRPVAVSATEARGLDVQGGALFRLPYGRKVLGVTQDEVAIDTAALTRIYFNGFGMATYDGAQIIPTIASAATVETLINEMLAAGMILVTT